MSVTRHKSLKAKQRTRREIGWAGAESVGDTIADDDPGAAAVIEEAERDQAVRDAVEELPGRCQQLVRMLFFSEEPLPYADAAARLGLAVGSIGFIRGRCLKKLESALKARGL